MRMQRCWISKVWGYSAWSMKLRWRLLSITIRASGSIQVVTKVARFRSGMPSTASSSSTKRIAPIAGIGSSGISRSGAPRLIHSPIFWRASSSTFIQILLIAPAEPNGRFLQSNHAALADWRSWARSEPSAATAMKGIDGLGPADHRGGVRDRLRRDAQAERRLHEAPPDDSVLRVRAGELRAP